MFGFGARCPVDLREKVWTETRLQWLCQKFGKKYILDASVLEPTSEFFPGALDGTAESVKVWFDRVCEHFGCSADQYSLFVQTDEDPELVDPYVFVPADCVADPVRLVSTIARGLARCRLLESGFLSGDDPDFFQVVDLLAVARGFGIFQVNTAISTESESNGLWHAWGIRFDGYLQARIPGYAMSLIAWLRSETAKPKWVHRLNQDGKAAYLQGRKFLHKTGKSLVTPSNVDGSGADVSTLTRADEMLRGTDSQKLHRLWQHLDNPIPFSDAQPAITALLVDREPILVAAATVVAAGYGTDAKELLPLVIPNLEAQHTETRVCSLLALASLHPDLVSDSQEVRMSELLKQTLNDRNPVVAECAVSSLVAYGDDAGPLCAGAVPFVLRLLKNCDFSRLHRVLGCIEPLVGSLPEFFSEAAEGADGELLALLESELKTRLDNSDGAAATTMNWFPVEGWIRMPVNFNNLAGVSRPAVGVPGQVSGLQSDEG